MMKKIKCIPVLLMASSAMLLAACNGSNDEELNAVRKFKDLTPPGFSDVVSEKDDIADEWSQLQGTGRPLYKVIKTRKSPKGCEGGSYYYLADMQQKTIQPLMNALCLADNITLKYREETDRYTREKYFVYSHDGKDMGRLLLPENQDNDD